MSRIRMLFGTAGVALLLVALVSATQAQAPGGGRGGPGGGFGGPGGGFGGRGGGGGIIGLLDYPAVQTEIELTDTQKQQVADIKAAIAKKRQQVMPARNNNGGNGNGGNVAAAQAGGAQGGAAQGGGAQGGGGQGGGRGGRFQMTPELQAAFQEVREYSDSMNAKILTKVLNKKQAQRLTQIDLQRQGPTAVLREDIAAKLNIGPDQLEQMQTIQQEGRQARRDAMQAAFQSNAQNFQTPDGQIDRAAIRAYRDSAAGKAQQAAIQQQMTTLQDQTIAAIGKVLTKKQKANFYAMLGKPFDLSKLTRESLNQNAAAATDTAKKADTTTKADTGTAKPSTTKKSTTKKKAATRTAASN